MEMIARITTGLNARCTRPVFPIPPVVVPIAAFDLMGSRSRTPGEPVRKFYRSIRGSWGVHRKLP